MYGNVHELGLKLILVSTVHEIHPLIGIKVYLLRTEAKANSTPSASFPRDLQMGNVPGTMILAADTDFNIVVKTFLV